MSLFALIAFASAASAADLSVCASGCDYSTLQSAVAGAQAGDTLLLEAETYTGEVRVTKQLHIEGPAQGAAIIDADGDEMALWIRTTGVTLSNVHITGADGFCGLRVGRNGDLEAEDVYVYGNSGTYGGAYIRGALWADLFVVGANTTTSFFAGGVNVHAGALLDVTNGTFLGNQGYNGGAIGNMSADVLIYASSFTANSAYLGGAIHNDRGNTEVEASSFSTNHADTLGGAWSNHNYGGAVLMVDVGYAANTTGSGSYADCYDVNGGCTQ